MFDRKLSNIYYGMISRCFDCRNVSYKYYGAIGVSVCKEWTNKERAPGTHNCSKGYLSFKTWAYSHGYKDGLSIDRIDSSKGYSPENCRWVTPKEQANNKRNNLCITYKDKTQTLAQWCDELGLNYDRTFRRLNIYHWSVEKVFETNDARIRYITYKGRTQSIAQWCKELGLNAKVVRNRLNKLHWSVEKAFNYKKGE